MTSHYPVSSDRQVASTSYDSNPVVVFPDGSVMWEQSDSDRCLEEPAVRSGGQVAAAAPRMSAGSIVLGVAIALFSTGFGAILPRMVSTPDPVPASCPQAPSSLPPFEQLNHRTQTLSSVGCNARR